MGRILGLLGVMLTMAAGVYFYSIQVKATSPTGTGNPRDIADLAGVKNDLISIANAERGYLASEGRYASLDELVAGKYITITSRPPYTYEAEPDSDGFRVTATRATPGSPVQLSIDQSMEIQESSPDQ
jgi:hypothetical protein